MCALSAGDELRWKFETGQTVASSPAIAADGSVYFGSQDGYFYALWQDGRLKWKWWADGSLASSPAIKDDGVVLVSIQTGWVIALQDRNGGPDS